MVRDKTKRKIRKNKRMVNNKYQIELISKDDCSFLNKCEGTSLIAFNGGTGGIHNKISTISKRNNQILS